jgi:hypothetical protein
LADLEFVSELLEKLVVPTLSALETELPTNQAPKKEWTIRFCKQMSFLRHALDGLHSYYLEDADSKKGGKELSDKGFDLSLFVHATSTPTADLTVSCFAS